MRPISSQNLMDQLNGSSTKEYSSSIPIRKTRMERNREKIIGVVNNLSQEELERISEMLRQTDEEGRNQVFDTKDSNPLEGASMEE